MVIDPALLGCEASFVGEAGANPYKKWAIAAAIDKDAKGPTWGWAVMEQAGKPNFALIETVGDQWGGPNETVQLSLHQNLDNPQHTLGRFRISVTTSPRPVTASLPTDAEVLAALQTPAEQRTEAQQATLSGYYRTIAPRLAPMREELASVEAERKKVNDSITITLVTKTVAPRTVRVLARGNWMDDKGEIVEPGFPACLPQLTRPQRLTRLDLAQWIVSPQHPLTARVFVNRIWKLYFGAGLSRKLDDLGSQGEWPSHPELLDWLAIRFIDSGWDVKQLVKLIVMSETYQRDSAVSPEHYQMDVANRWLSRQSRFRLDAEFLRDNALKVSGLLVPQIGGRSVKPYQPPGYWAYLNFPQREWQNGSGAELYRRGLYTHWQRQYLHPSMATFDAPGREECTADRPRSNTPLQSLVLLNDPSYVEAARALAEKALLQGGATQDEKLAWMVRQVLIRPIRDEEKLLLGALLDSHRSQYAAQLDSAKEVVKIGEHPVPAELASQFASSDSSTIELASWISVARVMLNLHETVTRP